MVGWHSGFISWLKTMAPQTITTHCELYRENLVAKCLDPDEAMTTMTSHLQYLADEFNDR